MNEGPRMNGEGAIEMRNPMEDMVSEDIASEVEGVVAEGEGNIVVFNEKADVEEIIPKSNKDGFNDSEPQDARYDSKNEGGVTNPNRTTGPMKLFDNKIEGGVLRQDKVANVKKGVYELSGFHVEAPTNSGMVSQPVVENYNSVEAAKAAIHGSYFSMPFQGSARLECKITRGAPIICLDERQVLEYIEGEWRRP